MPNPTYLLSLLTTLAVSAYNTAAAPWPGTATASSGQDAYIAQHAVDDDPKTRWGSNFTDDEWWQFAFTEEHTIYGLRIHWETAYGEAYKIQTSRDGTTWTTVFEEDDGDGNTDIIFFEPTATRYLRLLGIRRGTGWGYSIWEIDLYADGTPHRLSATDEREGHEAARAMDGDLTTGWSAAADHEPRLTITLPEPMELGGVELHWGEAFATSYSLEAKRGDQDWRSITTIPEANGARDYVYFPAVTADQLRLTVLGGSSAEAIDLRAFRLKGGDEQATPLREYRAAAQDARAGLYPRWLRREQEFWTAVGRTAADRESILGETGTFEPYKNSFSVMPFLQVDGGPWVTWSDVVLKPSLLEGDLPLPTASWKTETWQLDVTAVPYDRNPGTLVRYRLRNNALVPFTGRLVLALRPVQLNPAWQYGGFSPMNEVAIDVEDPIPFIDVNGETRVVLTTLPQRVGTLKFERGDILAGLDREKPLPLEAQHEQGMLSAGLAYDLEVGPAEFVDVVVLFPFEEVNELDPSLSGQPSAAFDAVRGRAREEWRELVGQVALDIPEERLLEVFRSNLAYILINQDGPWIKPGPRNYNHSWMRDGSMTGLALLRADLHQPVRRFLEAYIPLVDERGWVPWIVHEGGNPVAFQTETREGHEYDSQGQFVFLVRSYFDFTGDETLARQAYPAVVRALRFAQALRRERMTEAYRTDPEKQPYYGILPESNSHEGYYPAMHSYWDDFWLLRGLKDGIHLARALGHPEDAAWMEEEEADFRSDLYASIARVIERDQLEYIPGCVEKGDFDATSTAIAVMVADEGPELPQPYAQQTFERYYQDFLDRLEPGGAESFTPYEVRTADAFVRMGMRERALTMLRHFTEDSTRPYAWNHFAEVVHGRLRTPSYIGDMPHTWVGSGYVSAVRTLFAYEEEDRLVLAGGIDPAWLEQGVVAKGLPTRFGYLNMTLQNDGNAMACSIEGSAAPPGGFRIPLPEGLASRDVVADEGEATLEDGVLRFSSLPLAVRLVPSAETSEDAP